MGSMHTRKILGAVEWTVGGYTDVNGDSRGSSERKEEIWRKSLHLLREYMMKQTECWYSRNMGGNIRFSESSDKMTNKVLDNEEKLTFITQW